MTISNKDFVMLGSPVSGSYIPSDFPVVTYQLLRNCDEINILYSVTSILVVNYCISNLSGKITPYYVMLTRIGIIGCYNQWRLYRGSWGGQCPQLRSWPPRWPPKFSSDV